MTTTYETKMDAVLTDIDTVLKTVTAFSNRVYKGYYKDLGENYPSCLYMPTHDKPRLAATRWDHMIDVELLIFTRGGDNTPDVDIDNLISISGDVFEAIDTAQDKTWRWCRIADVDYSFNRDKSLIFYICHMIVTCEVRW